MAKINLKSWENAIMDTRGIITLIAKKLGVNRLTVYEFLKRNPKAKEMYEAECEKVYDVAETKLHSAMNRQESWAIRTLLLDHKRGRARGYGTKHEIEQSGEINHKLTLEIIDHENAIDTSNEDTPKE